MTCLVIAQAKIENPDIAIANLVDITKKVISIGVTTPPPPTPAIVDNDIKTESTTSPIISFIYGGKAPL